MNENNQISYPNPELATIDPLYTFSEAEIRELTPLVHFTYGDQNLREYILLEIIRGMAANMEAAKRANYSPESRETLRVTCLIGRWWKKNAPLPPFVPQLHFYDAPIDADPAPIRLLDPLGEVEPLTPLVHFTYGDQTTREKILLVQVIGCMAEALKFARFKNYSAESLESLEEACGVGEWWEANAPFPSSGFAPAYDRPAARETDASLPAIGALALGGPEFLSCVEGILDRAELGSDKSH